MLKLMPTDINWDGFLEMTDNVEGIQMLSCTAGSCEIR
jgi:hypothetical protein